MAAGASGIFRGLRFMLMGFDRGTDDEHRKAIKMEGGSFEKLYIWKDLYVIASSETLCNDDPICAKARENGAILINELWLVESLRIRALADTNRVLYRPPVTLGGIKGAQNLHISHTGFPCDESIYIEKLVDMIGAQNADRSNCSFLICNTLADYEAEEATDFFKVNKWWLEDIVRKWVIVSVDNYKSWHRKANSRNYRTPSKDDNDDNVMNSKRLALSTGSKNKPALTTGSKNRLALSTGAKKQHPLGGEHVPEAPVLRRRLNFDWRKLSEYEASEMVIKVRIPRSSMEKEIGTAEIKGALSCSYTALANIHSGGQCIRNNFSASSFRVSTYSEQVMIEQPQLVEYDESLSLANRQQFALMVRELFKEKRCSLPDDISGWLSSIVDVDKVSDRVLKHHINMQHPIDAYGSFLSMYYIVLRLKEEDFAQYTLIMQSRHVKKYRFWAKRFRWKLFQDTLKHINPKKVELNSLRAQVSNSGVSGQANICTPKARGDDVFGLLEVVRDSFIHPAMIYKDLLLPVLLTEYPRLLVDLQRALFELGHLPNLK